MSNELNETTEATNKLLLEMVKNQKSANKNLTKVFISAIIGYTLLLIAMVVGFFVYESQFETAEEIKTDTEISVDQEASGEDAEINNVLGDMYKDNATHNEGIE